MSTDTGRMRALLPLLLLSPDAFAALDRPFTLRNHEPHLVEREREELIRDSTGLTFASPATDRVSGFAPPPSLSHSDSSRQEDIGLVLVGGEEYRRDGVGTWATDIGGILSGRKGYASFHLDARIFAENHSRPVARSYDREEVDTQERSSTGSVSYVSYSRYRGRFTLETRLGDLSVARDAAHWGPAMFNNLAFNQNAVPFDQITYHASIGPVRAVSMYGDLVAGSSQAYSPENLGGRNLYAHRYELSIGRDLLLGVTEQLILYDQNKPYLFVPVFPLFMAKGFMYEESNNGNLAADLAWRLSGRWLLYGEFLLDDLESPTSLFLKDYSQNKWGWLAGFHFADAGRLGTLGFLAEYARIEPWVYSHFTPNTAQAANVGFPLGNPYGPNSQNVTFKAYFRARGGAYLGLAQSLLWKGTDPGSGLDDAAPRDSRTPKSFLGGAGDPEYSVRPEVHWVWKGLSVGFAGDFGGVDSFWSGIRYFY